MKIFEAIQTVSKSQAALTVGAVTVGFMMSEAAFAGTGGAEFNDVWTTLTEWTTGTLGRIVAGAMILVGIIGGIARQSLMAFAMGVAGGMGLYNTPTIIESIMSATLENAPTIAPAVIQITNGLGG
jgi:conjugal transfer pilus assembly protein TraA